MGVKYVEIEKIDNYIENPRHEVGLNELDTLKKLFDVSVKSIILCKILYNVLPVSH
ncbi:hypothetical protein G9M13_15055 [Listeria monocytogenes]|nr:hypothetical protein G9M13_15055 [Listeria monocytogenes]